MSASQFRPAGYGDLGDWLEAVYREFSRPDLIHPDPLELVLAYKDPEDQEVAGLVAASLATGNVRSILDGARSALARLGPNPARALDSLGLPALRDLYGDYRYRFFSGDDLASMLAGLRGLRSAYGSMGKRLVALVDREAAMVPALARLIAELREAAGQGFKKALLPSPDDGSACKRTFLFLRWMCRQDAVDPGPWPRGLEPHLVMPLDTHSERVGRMLGLLSAKSGGLRMALELTAGFREWCPEDPVRYDFALTRPGINRQMDTGADFAFLRPGKEGA